MSAVLMPLCILGFIVLVLVDRAFEHAAKKPDAHSLRTGPDD